MRYLSVAILWAMHSYFNIYYWPHGSEQSASAPRLGIETTDKDPGYKECFDLSLHVSQSNQETIDFTVPLPVAAQR